MSTGSVLHEELSRNAFEQAGQEQHPCVRCRAQLRHGATQRRTPMRSDPKNCSCAETMPRASTESHCE